MTLQAHTVIRYEHIRYDICRRRNRATSHPCSSHPYWQNGNYSIEVIRRALAKSGLSCDAVGSERACAALTRDGGVYAAATAFLVHRRNHWFALRRIAGGNGTRWFHLDSLCGQGPTLVDDRLLDAFVLDLIACPAAAVVGGAGGGDAKPVSKALVFRIDEDYEALPRGWERASLPIAGTPDAAIITCGETSYFYNRHDVDAGAPRWRSPPAWGWRVSAQRQSSASRAALADRRTGRWFDGDRVVTRHSAENVDATKSAHTAALVGSSSSLLERGTWLAAAAVRADTAREYRKARYAYTSAASLLFDAIRAAEASAPGAWRGEGRKTRPPWCADVERTVTGYIARAEEIDTFLLLSSVR